MTYIPPIVKACTLATLVLSQAACADKYTEAPDSILLNNADNKYNHWNGVGKIFRNEKTPYCTATLLDTSDTENGATGPAYVLTAGHCVLKIHGAKSDVPFKQSIKFNYFTDTPDSSKFYSIHKASWTSMASTDVAILELTESLETLINDGINPLRIASEAPSAPGKVNIVHAPQRDKLHLSSCTQEPSGVSMIKFSVFTDYLKQDCKGIGPGSSGAPTLDATTGEIIGVLSGTTLGLSADDLCFWFGLCPDNKRQSLLPDEAVQSPIVNYFSDCFSNGYFNTGTSACTLKPNFDFTSESHIDMNKSSLKTALKPAPHETPPAWDIKFSMSTPFYRFKTVRDAKACYLPDHYSGTLSTKDAAIDAPIGNEAGLYFLCLLGVESAEQRPSIGLIRNTQIFPARIVAPNFIKLPDPTPVIELSENNDTYSLIQWRDKKTLNMWTWAYTGPVGTTDCDTIPRKDYIQVGDAMFIQKVKLPLMLCSYTEDREFNTSDVHTFVVALPTSA